jgi:hypothetical protein
VSRTRRRRAPTGPPQKGWAFGQPVPKKTRVALVVIAAAVLYSYGVILVRKERANRLGQCESLQREIESSLAAGTLDEAESRAGGLDHLCTDETQIATLRAKLVAAEDAGRVLRAEQDRLAREQQQREREVTAATEFPASMDKAISLLRKAASETAKAGWDDALSDLRAVKSILDSFRGTTFDNSKAWLDVNALLEKQSVAVDAHFALEQLKLKRRLEAQMREQHAKAKALLDRLHCSARPVYNPNLARECTGSAVTCSPDPGGLSEIGCTQVGGDHRGLTDPDGVFHVYCCPHYLIEQD